MKRREFLVGTFGCTLMASVQATAKTIKDPGPDRFFGAAMSELGTYVLSSWRFDGQEVFRAPLPARGHAPLARPNTNEIVIFARRPGTFALVLSADTGNLIRKIKTDSGRHFYGHGAFSHDGRYLYSTENDFEAAKGIISCYEAASGYKKVGEISSYGMGPHDIKVMADRRTLVVANGGIATHPDTGRAKLNLAEMTPSIAFIDCYNGRLLRQATLPPAHHKLSLRHLALLENGVVAVAMQNEGSQEERAPLVALCRPDQGLSFLPTPPSVLAKMKNYCGSVAVDKDRRYLAATCPRGGITVFWEVARGQYLTYCELRDGCGLESGIRSGDFVITSGEGAVMQFNPATGEKRFSEKVPGGVHWDNHLMRFGSPS